MNLPGILILELDEAAAGAAVAQRFPFLGAHLPKLLVLPEGAQCPIFLDLTFELTPMKAFPEPFNHLLLAHLVLDNAKNQMLQGSIGILAVKRNHAVAASFDQKKQQN